jgi:hypothetical protein
MKFKLSLFFGALFLAVTARAQTPDEYANKSLQDEICASKKRTEELEIRLKANLQKKKTVEFEVDFKTYSEESAKLQKELSDKITQLNYDYALKLNKLSLVFKAKYEIPFANDIPINCK